MNGKLVATLALCGLLAACGAEDGATVGNSASGGASENGASRGDGGGSASGGASENGASGGGSASGGASGSGGNDASGGMSGGSGGSASGGMSGGSGGSASGGTSGGSGGSGGSASGGTSGGSGGSGGSAPEVNTAPVADAQNVGTQEDTPVAITLTGSDADGDSLTYSVTAGPAHGTLSGTAPQLTYTPSAGFSGADSFMFIVDDGVDSSAPSVVSITVTPTDTVPVNTAPVANTQNVGTQEDTPVAITLTGSDADGDSLTYSVTAGPAHGTLSGTAPQLTYTPSAGFSGADSFSFVVNDGTVNSAPADVNITVTPAPSFYTIGGTVLGSLYGDVALPILHNNGGDALVVAGSNFQFASPLADGSRYSVSVASDPPQQLCALDNASGLVFGANVDNVSLQCRFWRGGIDIQGEEAWHVERPQIAFDAAGNAIAVWQQWNTRQSGWFQSRRVYASRYTVADGSWGTPQSLDVPSTGNGSSLAPQVVVSPGGDAAVVWRWTNSLTDEDVEYHLRAAHYSVKSDEWSEVQAIRDDSSPITEHRAGMDEEGNVFVVWQQDDGKGLSVGVSRYSKGTWADTLLDDLTTDNEPARVRIAVAPAGEVACAWHQEGFIRARYYSPSANAWDAVETIGEIGPFLNAVDIDIDIDQMGDAMVIWSNGEGHPSNILVKRYSVKEASWDATPVVVADGTGVASARSHPKIAIDLEGNATALWELLLAGSAGTRSLRASRYSPKGGWGEPAELGELGPIETAEAQLVSDAAGNAMAVWRRDDEIWANRYSVVNGSWDDVLYAPVAFTSGIRATNPQVAFDAAGNAVAVFKVPTLHPEYSAFPPEQIWVSHFE